MMLQLHIVPKTRIVKLASPAFYYKGGTCSKNREAKGKDGSYQVFISSQSKQPFSFNTHWNLWFNLSRQATSLGLQSRTTLDIEAERTFVTVSPGSSGHIYMTIFS